MNIMNLIGPDGGHHDHVITEEKHTTSASFCNGLSIYFPDRADRFNPDYLMGNDFIHYLFLSVVSRTATQEELDELNTIIASRGYDKEGKEQNRAMIVLDYLSRLPELYYTTSIN